MLSFLFPMSLVSIFPFFHDGMSLNMVRSAVLILCIIKFNFQNYSLRQAQRVPKQL